MKRVKRRYLALQLECNSSVTSREFSDAVWNAITRLYGEYGASQMGLTILDYHEEKKTALIRVSLATLQQVRASLASITKIAGKEAAIHLMSISGTIKTLREKTN